MPMALRLVLSWSDAAVEFLGSVWSDAHFDDARATDLTIWAGEELIPSCPRGIPLQPIGANLARSLHRATLLTAMMKWVFTVHDLRRANMGLQILKDALGVDDDELNSSALEAINGIT